MKKDGDVSTPPTTPVAAPADDNNRLALGEFTSDEVARSPLDNLNKKDRDYTHVRHVFATDEQYDIFCMLPGGTAVKDLIISDFLGGEDKR